MRFHKQKPDEEWVLITGFPAYEVSDLGRVRTSDTQKLVEPKVKDGKVTTVSLSNDGKYCLRSLPRLVADHFLPPHPTDQAYVVDFKDGDPHNFAASNLKWESRVKKLSENLARYHAKPLGERRAARKGAACGTAVPIVCIDTDEIFPSQAEVADLLRVPKAQVSRAVQGLVKEAAGLRWRRATEEEVKLLRDIASFEATLEED